MEVMSVGDSGIGIPQNVPKVPEILAQSPQNDSLLSSMYDINPDDSGVQLQHSGNTMDVHQLGDPYPDSARESEGGASISKDSGYGLKSASPAVTHARTFLRNQEADMYLPKVASPRYSTPSQKELKRKAGKKGLVHPLNPRGSKVQDESQFDVNPEAVPFLPQNFMSSTVLKKITVPKRHLDTFGGMEYSVTGRRGVILHTDRYHWSSFQPLDGMSQRDRLIAELTYMEKLRGVKRRREVLPHRAQLDLFMGGRKIDMEERFDITREIQKLKSLVLPRHARDLYHGRGFKLPENHSSLNPRGPPYDITEEISASAPASLQQHFRMNPDFLTDSHPSQPTFLTSSRKGKKRGQLPSLNKRHDMEAESPVLLSKEKRTVTNLQARLYLPRSMMLLPAMKDESYPAIKSRHSVLPSVEANSLNRSPAAWVADQNRRILAGGGRVEVPAPPFEDNKHKDTDSDTDMDRAEKKPKATVSPEAPSPTIVPNRTSPGPTELTAEGRTSVSPVKGTTAHPLMGAELVQSVPVSEQDLLRATFQRLDTDMDGSLNYTQLKTTLPDSLYPGQEMFVKHVYDLTHSSTSLFGVEDFMNMKQLTQALDDLEGDAMAAFKSLDTHKGVDTAIKKFVELFQSVDRSNRGKISVESLQTILSTGLERDLTADEVTWNTIKNTMGIVSSPHVTKLEFLAHLPYFLTLQVTKS